MITKEERRKLKKQRVAELLLKRYNEHVVAAEEVIQLLANIVTDNIETNMLEEDEYFERETFALLFAIKVIKENYECRKLEYFKERVLNEWL